MSCLNSGGPVSFLFIVGFFFCRVMFWSDVGGDTHRIMRAYMDGTNETVFVANAVNAASKNVLNKGPPPPQLTHTHTHTHTHTCVHMQLHTTHVHFSVVNKTDEAS